MSEPTIAEVELAVRRLPRRYLDELAKGPLDDRDDCRICELFDDFIYGYYGGGSWSVREAVSVLVDWHRFYGSPGRDGRGEEAFRRCQRIYELAREALA